MEKVILAVGYKDVTDFVLKFVLPVFGASFAAFLIVMLAFTVPWYLPYGFLLFGVVFIFAYPYTQYEKKKVDIHENIHLFITYAGTISTLDLTRAQLFRKVATQKQFGEISETAERILYLAKDWNMGFAHACRALSKLSPSQIWTDFLDRLAAVLDFGEDLRIFLTEEQESVMTEYASQYQQSLENIKMLQDMFISLTVAIAFALSAALLLPLLMGVSIIVVVQYGLLALVLLDIGLILMIKVFIPSDQLSITLGVSIDSGETRVRRWLMIAAPTSIIIFATLLFLDVVPLLFGISLASIPLFFVGLIAMQEENAIFNRDKAYPVFIRAVGSTIHVRGGGVVSALGALQVHDFGVLQPMMSHLYRRLRLGTDTARAWLYFSAETGSSLIYHFTRIFTESIYIGGNGEKIGKIISDNFAKLINLRKLRLQLAGGMRGALYGGLVGFVVTVYMAATITDLLAKLFGSTLTTPDGANQAAQLFSSVLPAIPPVDMGQVSIYIAIMVVVHSLSSSYILKIIDGGKWQALFFDLCIMLFIGSAIAFFVPKMSGWAFGSIIFNSAPLPG